MANVGVKGLQVIRASAQYFPFRKGVFDFALCLDVLEHLSKPREVAAEIYRVIKSEALVAI